METTGNNFDNLSCWIEFTNDIVNEYNEIFSQEVLNKLLQIIFSYDIKKKDWEYEEHDYKWYTFFNETLFRDFGWITEVSEHSEKEITEKLLNLWKRIRKIKDKILSVDYTQNSKLCLVLWSINNSLKVLDLLILWLPFELEKAWVECKLTNEERLERIEKLKKLDSEIFWWEIRDNSFEVLEIYKYMCRLKEKERNKLDDSEKDIIQKSIDSTRWLIPWNIEIWDIVIENDKTIFNNIDTIIEILDKDNIDIWRLIELLSEITKYVWNNKLNKNLKWFLSRISDELNSLIIILNQDILFVKRLWILKSNKNLEINKILDNIKNICEETKKYFLWQNKQIHRNKYKKIFELVLKIYWIDLKIVENKSISAFWVFSDWFHIPANEWLDFISMSRLVELIQHEIETHIITNVNSSNVLWNFRWWNYSHREEWIATISEYLLKWEPLETITVWWNDCERLIWEIYCWKELIEFMKVMTRLSKWKKFLKNLIWIFARRKRCYPFDEPWVQHKDTVYSRWRFRVLEIINKINSWEEVSLSDHYKAKVSFEDIDLVKDLWNDVQLIFPLLIWELLLFAISHNNITEKKFNEFIKLKYWVLFNDSVRKLNIAQRKAVVEII